MPMKNDTILMIHQGLHETRRVLRETLEWPTKYAPIFAQSPLRLRSGSVLYVNSRQSTESVTAYCSMDTLAAEKHCLLLPSQKNVA